MVCPGSLLTRYPLVRLVIWHQEKHHPRALNMWLKSSGAVMGAQSARRLNQVPLILRQKNKYVCIKISRKLSFSGPNAKKSRASVFHMHLLFTHRNSKNPPSAGYFQPLPNARINCVPIPRELTFPL